MHECKHNVVQYQNVKSFIIEITSQYPQYISSHRTQNTVISLLRLYHIHQLIGYNQQAGSPRPSSPVPEMCFPKGVRRGPVYIYPPHPSLKWLKNDTHIKKMLMLSMMVYKCAMCMSHIKDH